MKTVQSVLALLHKGKGELPSRSLTCSLCDTDLGSGSTDEALQRILHEHLLSSHSDRYQMPLRYILVENGRLGCRKWYIEHTYQPEVAYDCLLEPSKVSN